MTLQPTWQRGDVQLYLGDCREILPHLPKVDAVVTDPPYGIALKCGTQTRSVLAPVKQFNDVYGDKEPFDPSQILSLDVPTCLWGANWFADKLPNAGGWLVWDKLRPDTLDQATCELAWTNFVKGVRRFRHLWNGMMKASEREESYHPTQKPVALFAWIFSLPWTPTGTILDPYMGSGPCGVAAVLSGRRYIGCEIERQYFDIAVKRISEAQDQFALFDPVPPPIKQSELFGGGE